MSIFQLVTNIGQFEVDLKKTIKEVENGVRKWLDKGSDIVISEIQKRTPIRTWRLRKSNVKKDILSKDKQIVSITNDTPYGVFVEFGTKFMAARGMYEKGLRNSEDQVVDQILKSL